MVVHRRQADPRKDGRTCLPPCGHVAALLDTHAADLDRRIAELTALREEVGRLRDRARGLDPAACDDAKYAVRSPSLRRRRPRPPRRAKLPPGSAEAVGAGSSRLRDARAASAAGAVG